MPEGHRSETLQSKIPAYPTNHWYIRYFRTIAEGCREVNRRWPWAASAKILCHSRWWRGFLKVAIPPSPSLAGHSNQGP